MTLEMRIDEERHFARKEGEVLTTVRLVLKKLSQQKSIEEISDFLEISSDSVVLIRDLAVQLDYDEEKITDTLINERRF